jgi:hypothetical protein
MKNQGNQIAKEQVNNTTTVIGLQKESLTENSQTTNGVHSRNLSKRLKSFIDHLDMSFRRIDSGLM